MFRKLFGYFGPMFDAEDGLGGGGATGGEPSGASTEPGAGGTVDDGGASQGGSPTGAAGQNTDPTPAEKTYTQSQVEALIRGRVAEAKTSIQNQFGDHDRYKKLATKLAEMTGSSLENIESELEALEAQTVSKQTGVPPQVYQAMKEQKKELDQIKSDGLKFKLDAEEAKMMLNPLFKDALNSDDVKTEIRDFAEKYNLPLEQAFWATQGSKGTQQMERDIEQRIMASIANKADKSGIISDSGTGLEDPNFGLTPEEIEMCKQFGDDPEEMAAMKGTNSLDGFLKFKSKKKK